MASPAFHFASQASLLEYSAAAASPVVATLDDLSGVDSVSWAVTSTDDSDTVAARAATVVVSGTKNSVCTVTAAGVGTGGLLQCTVNAGVDKQTDQPSAALTVSAKWFVPTANGLQVGVANEQLQAHPTFGWGKAVNETARKVDALSPSGVAATSAATPNALALRDGSAGCAFVTVAATSFVDSGTHPATTGLLRGLTNSSLVDARNAANTGNMSLVSVLATDDMVLGDANTLSVQIGAGFLQFGLAANHPATAGSVRLLNSSRVMARNAANSQNLLLIASDAGDSILVGDPTNGSTATIQAKAAGSVILALGVDSKIVVVPDATFGIQCYSGLQFLGTTPVIDTVGQDLIIGPSCDLVTIGGGGGSGVKAFGPFNVETGGGAEVFIGGGGGTGFFEQTLLSVCQVTTTDATTPTELTRWTTATGHMSIADVHVMGVVTTNGHGLQGAVVSYEASYMTKNAAGTAAAVTSSIPTSGAGITFKCDETAGAFGVVGLSLTHSGADTILSTTGAAGQTVLWNVRGKVVDSPMS